MESQDAVKALAALAQGTRLSIFRLLVQAGPEGLPAGRIATELDTAAPTLSFHLKELSHAGLITPRQDGRYVIYSANFPRMAALLSYLTENCCRGMPQECLSVVETALAGCCTPRSCTPKRKGARR